jgi:hypothetical protein
LLDEATGTPEPLTIDEIVARVSRLGLVRRKEPALVIPDDRGR